MSTKIDLLKALIKEEIISLQGKSYQIPKSKAEELLGLMSDMGIEEFDPLKTPAEEGFAAESHWKNWVSDVEGIISEDKLSKLYFKLYELGSASTKTKFLDNVLSAIYDADPNALAKDLFSVDGPSESVSIPPSLLQIAQLNTVSAGGSKANEIGKGELVIPLLFADARGEYGNALYDLQVGGQNWHCKSIASQNSDVRSSKLLGPIGSEVVKKYGTAKGEFGAKRAVEAVEGIAEILEMPKDSPPGEVMIKFQETLNDEYREQLKNEAGVIFYVEGQNTLYFRPAEEVIVNRITANQPSIGMGIGSPGAYAKAAQAMRESKEFRSNILEAYKAENKILQEHANQIIRAQNKAKPAIRRLMYEAFSSQDKDQIKQIAGKVVDEKWKKELEDKVEALLEKQARGFFNNDHFYKAVADVWKQLMRVYAQDQYQYARRYTRYDVPLAKYRP